MRLQQSDTEKNEYSIENAIYFNWSSITGALDSERTKCLIETLKGEIILEAGCGGGAYSQFLAMNGFTVYAVDINEEFLGIARKKHPGPTYLCQDLCHPLPFPDKFFDSAFCFDVLEHLDDVTALRELIRVTKYRLIFTVPQKDMRSNRWYLTYGTYLDQTHLRYYTKETIEELLNKCGIQNAVVSPHTRIPLEDLVRIEFKAISRWPLLTSVYRFLFNFLALRLHAPDWYINWLVVADI